MNAGVILLRYLDIDMNRMATIIVLSLILALLLSTGCDRQTETSIRPTESSPSSGSTNRQAADVSPDLSELIDRFHRLQSEQCLDDQRGEFLFADIEIENLPQEQEQEVRKLVLESIESWETRAQDPHPVRADPNDEKQILETIGRKEFEIDSRIAESDVNQIVTYLEKHPSLDPRILSLKYTDEDTIKIMTGEIRGPLNGGGSFYVARRENGNWIVRRTGSSWVS